jgi:hypothetical protein
LGSIGTPPGFGDARQDLKKKRNRNEKQKKKIIEMERKHF